MNEQTLITKISNRYGIDATDAVKDALATWSEETGREHPKTAGQWVAVEAQADAYAQDYLDTAVEDHFEECGDCEGTMDALAHIAE